VASNTKHKSDGTFQPGSHWRPPQDHWNREWLHDQYVAKRRSGSEIAAEMGCTVNNIYYWMDKHGIERRTISEVRAIKHWGLSGEANGMYGRTGPGNPRYVDGSSPLRQKMYSRHAWKQLVIKVYKRDNYRCQRCDSPHAKGHKLHAHHMRPWAGHEGLRFDIDNIITLCSKCHWWVHSKGNIEHEFLAD